MQFSRLSLFVLTSIGLLIFPDESEIVFWPQLVIWISCIILIARAMLKNKYFYSSTLLIVQSVVSVFFIYIYRNQRNVESTSVFAFSVFTNENLRIASKASLVAVVSIVLIYLLKKSNFRNNRENWNITQVIVNLLPRLSRVSSENSFLLLVLSFTISCIIFLTNVSIFEESYPYNAHSLWIPPIYFFIFYALIFLPYLIFLTKSLIFPKVSIRNLLLLSRINLIISPALLLFVYSSRGLMTVALFLIGVMELLLSARKRGNWAFGAICLVLSLYLIQSFPYLRFHLASSSESDIAVFIQSIEKMIPLGEESSSGNGGYRKIGNSIDLNDFPMIGQSLFHMLYVVDLVKQENTLNGSTFVNLIPQAIPQIVADWLEYERPLNDNWKLGYYYRHQGGFLAMANAYWNGGVWVMATFMLVLSSVVMFIDRYFAQGNRKIISVLGYWSLLPIFTVQLAYGIQGLVRVLQMLGLLILFDKVKFSKKK